MDCISHHSLHSHIPIHHYTNHTAVTNHSLTLIVSPHLHLIHTRTYKQHTSIQTLQSLVLAPADISERYSACYLLSLCLTQDCPTLELWTCACDPNFCLVLFTSLPCLWYSCFCPLTFACLILSIKHLTAHGSTRLWPVITEDFAKDESSSKDDVTPPRYKVHWGTCCRLSGTGTPDSARWNMPDDIFSRGFIWTTQFDHEATWTLEEYSDLALKLSGSPFTVGVAEEENHPPIGTSTAETCHKMAADPEPHFSPAKPESALIMPAKPESALIMPAKPESALARPAKPESLARMATTPLDAPLWPGLITSALDPPLVSVRAAGIPRPAPSQELAESAPGPAPSQELAESAPGPAPSQELAESAPGPAPSQELAESAPGPAPSPGARRVRSPAGPAQLSFVSAGPAQLFFVSAGPAQLSFSAGSVQFSIFRAPPRPSTSRVPPWGSGVPQELSGGELPAIAHWDPEPAMAHGVPWFILAARGPGSTMAT